MSKHIILVNNTSSDIRLIEAAIIEAIKAGQPLPEDLADMFSLEVITVDGKPRGILNFA